MTYIRSGTCADVNKSTPTASDIGNVCINKKARSRKILRVVLAEVALRCLDFKWVNRKYEGLQLH